MSCVANLPGRALLACGRVQQSEEERGRQQRNLTHFITFTTVLCNSPVDLTLRMRLIWAVDLGRRSRGIRPTLKVVTIVGYY